jgi:hypothetical protein
MCEEGQPLSPKTAGKGGQWDREVPQNTPGSYYPSDVISSKKHLEGILQTSLHMPFLGALPQHQRRISILWRLC